MRCRGRSLWLQRCDFRTVKKPFPLSTAAQNIHVFRRKSPLHKIHFFEWLKTENFSNACGTSTLKSPPSRGSDAPHVHPRLRKRLSRCTLDCGFKTPESPALRGFVAERCPIKVDANTGKGLYGVKFVIYDSGKNPIMEVETDQDGYAYTHLIEFKNILEQGEPSPSPPSTGKC